MFWLDACCAIFFLFHLVIVPVLSGYCMVSCCFTLQSSHATTPFQYPRSYLCFQIRSTITQSPNTIFLESDRNEKEISKEWLVTAPVWDEHMLIFYCFQLPSEWFRHDASDLLTSDNYVNSEFLMGTRLIIMDDDDLHPSKFCWIITSIVKLIMLNYTWYVYMHSNVNTNEKEYQILVPYIWNI